MKIIIRKIAQQELLQVKWYIQQDSEFYANKTVNEINKRIDKNERVLITTLTIRMSEELTNYLKEIGGDK